MCFASSFWGPWIPGAAVLAESMLPLFGVVLAMSLELTCSGNVDGWIVGQDLRSTSSSFSGRFESPFFRLSFWFDAN